MIFGATSKKAPAGFTGIAIGLYLISGSSVNPAQSLCPALLAVGTAHFAQLWVFIVEPVIGALIAAVVWKYLLEDSTSVG